MFESVLRSLRPRNTVFFCLMLLDTVSIRFNHATYRNPGDTALIEYVVHLPGTKRKGIIRHCSAAVSEKRTLPARSLEALYELRETGILLLLFTSFTTRLRPRFRFYKNFFLVFF